MTRQSEIKLLPRPMLFYFAMQEDNARQVIILELEPLVLMRVCYF